ncbi:hypothetical protein P7C73_g1121, partial [Tremellales sp. Uapishka_1]
MYRSTLRPLASAVRAYSTRPTVQTSKAARNALFAASTIVVAGVVMASQRNLVHNESGMKETVNSLKSEQPVHRSVLNQDSLFVPLHKASSKPEPASEPEKPESGSTKPAASKPDTRKPSADYSDATDGDYPTPKSSAQHSSTLKSTVNALKADSHPSTSVLNQSSLKTSVHKTGEAASDPAPQLIEDKAAEAKSESEAGPQGAFNEETGEINWDCPCLGGMADGPCGEPFKAAFSCFVYSEAEPKGMDCVEKFKNMQDCFREHPDIYGEEIDDDDELAPEGEKGASA